MAETRRLADVEQTQQDCPTCGAPVGVVVLNGRKAFVDREPVAPPANNRLHVWVDLMGSEQVGRVTQDKDGVALPPYTPEAHVLQMGALFRVHECGETDEKVGIDRAAELVGAHPNTIRKWIDRGVLAAERAGALPKSPWLIRVRDLEGLRGRKPPARA